MLTPLTQVEPVVPDVVPANGRVRIVALADDVAELEAAAPHLRALTELGHRVVLVWREGEPGPRLRSFTARIPVGHDAPAAAGTRAAVRRRVRRLTRVPTGLLRSRGSVPTPLVAALQAHARALRATREADLVAPVGDHALTALNEIGGSWPAVVTAEELTRWGERAAAWKPLRRGATSLDAEQSAALLAALRSTRASALRVDPAATLTPLDQRRLVPVIESLHAAGAYDDARELTAYLDTEVGVGPAMLSADEAALRAGLRLLVETSASGARQPGLDAAVRGLLAVADDALAGDDPDLDQAVGATTRALALLFHRELHADGTTSPLVTEPEEFLAAWRGSRVGRLLAQRVPRAPGLGRAREDALTPATSGRPALRPRVVVVPGSYPQFAAPVIKALAEVADVRTTDLRSRTHLRGLGIRRELVDQRLRQALGRPWEVDLELVEELEAADAVFVDWVDRGALLALMSVPEAVPVTVRIHSMDALSPWIHVADWSRVDHLVLVSEHLRALVERLLGDRLAGTRVHVVPNVLSPERIPTDKLPGHRRRLLMVGWAQRVKDPMWALEILAALRDRDPQWRLTLVGADFSDGTVRSQQRYAAAFRERLTRPDVLDAVDFVGWTPDVAPHLRAAGFVLSTSRRESFGLGLVEGAASGAVPVVREWPIFSPLGGARGLFPDGWVVDTPEQAAARISALSDEPAWSQASHEARQVVAQRFASADARLAVRRIVLAG